MKVLKRNGNIANDGDLMCGVCLECMDKQPEKNEKDDKNESKIEKN